MGGRKRQGPTQRARTARSLLAPTSIQNRAGRQAAWQAVESAIQVPSTAASRRRRDGRDGYGSTEPQAILARASCIHDSEGAAQVVAERRSDSGWWQPPPSGSGRAPASEASQKTSRRSLWCFFFFFWISDLRAAVSRQAPTGVRTLGVPSALATAPAAEPSIRPSDRPSTATHPSNDAMDECAGSWTEGFMSDSSDTHQGKRCPPSDGARRPSLHSKGGTAASHGAGCAVSPKGKIELAYELRRRRRLPVFAARPSVSWSWTKQARVCNLVGHLAGRSGSGGRRIPNGERRKSEAEPAIARKLG
ncbi:uncharacterized protein PSFLO_02660 [Pseudozyma flocculosa]|uniref:Uncharacterized protein n=1 Tax=Pseudozyma flocculosa TaxID=84751 RepID=A0A5C3EY84_9BASI|nr:uncharacterized protein PSFLO_02660 [Pseudozyma flocculosa]